MKKILLSMLALVAMAVSAQDVTFDFDANYATYFNTPGVSSGNGASYVADGEFTSDQVITSGDVKLTVKASAADASTPNRVWASSPRLRMYNESIVIESSKAIKTVTINLHKQPSNVKFDAAVDNEALKLNNDAVSTTWHGETTKLVIEIKNNTQIRQIVVSHNASAQEEVVDIKNTPETAYTATKALELIAAGKGLADKVYVKGTISRIENLDRGDYGNASYYISDGSKELYIYRGYGLENKKFNVEGTKIIEEGDDVVVYGKLKDYVKDDVHTPEMDSGNYLYSLNGETKNAGDTPTPGYTPTGAGTLSNPYTAADVKGLVDAGTAPTEKAWVKGTIVGTANSGTKLSSEAGKDDVVSNIAIGSADAWVPVELASKSEARTALNVVDTPSNLNKDVWVYGVITTYFSTAGVKSVSDYSFDGKTTAIRNINVQKSNVMFNIAGQRMNSAKGLVIINGKKVVL